jgi:hypothetical protein
MHSKLCIITTTAFDNLAGGLLNSKQLFLLQYPSFCGPPIEAQGNP